MRVILLVTGTLVGVACASGSARNAESDGLPEFRCIALTYDSTSMAVALPRRVRIGVENRSVVARWLPSPLDTIGYQRMFPAPAPLAFGVADSLVIRFSNGFSYSQLTFASLRDSVRGVATFNFDHQPSNPPPQSPFVGTDVPCGSGPDPS